MMVKPSQEYLECQKLIEPWLLFNAEKFEFYLPPDAPENVVKAWEWRKKHPLKTELD